MRESGLAGLGLGVGVASVGVGVGSASQADLVTLLPGAGLAPPALNTGVLGHSELIVATAVFAEPAGI